jgi:hypothetical protein
MKQLYLPDYRCNTGNLTKSKIKAACLLCEASGF